MKVALLLACTCAVLSSSAQSASIQAIKAPLDIISLEDISELERKHLEYLESKYDRPKRSGGGGSDVIGAIKSTIGQGIKSKLGMIAHGSASAISHFSGASSGGHHYDGPETYDSKSFDFWTLKKSILNTLLQAVKAIKGGVIAIKGQLIKGSGHLITAKGKLISTKGEAITNLGKNIASSAMLSPLPHHGYSSSGHEDYVSHADHDHHDHSSEEHFGHGSHSAPGPAFITPDHHHHHHPPPPPPLPAHDKPHAGILILKKMPSAGRGHYHSTHEDHKVPDFKPIESSGPGFGTIIGKFFSASTSMTPGEPKPFGHTGYDSQEYSSIKAHLESHEDHPPPPPSHHHHSSDHDHYESHPPSGPDSSYHHEDAHHAPASASSAVDNSHLKPPSTSYGTPFEKEPSYLSADDYQKEESVRAPEAFSTNSIKVQAPLNSSEHHPQNDPPKVYFKPQMYDEIRPISSFGSTGKGQDFLGDKPKHFFGAGSQEAYPPINGYQTAGLDMLNNFGSTFNSPVHTNLEFLSGPIPDDLVYPSTSDYNSFYRPPSFLQNHNSFVDNTPLPSGKVPQRRPSKRKVPSKHMTPPALHRLNVVKSIAYELGPHGPKRI